MLTIADGKMNKKKNLNLTAQEKTDRYPVSRFPGLVGEASNPEGCMLDSQICWRMTFPKDEGFKKLMKRKEFQQGNI